MKEIETQRLRLRLWTKEDAKELFAYATSPNVGPSAGWKPHENIEESQKIIEQLFLQNDVWAVTLKESGKIVGSIGIEFDKRRPGVSSKELGYSLSEQYWGKGIMTEAAKAVIDFGFSKLGLEVIAACTGPQNARSQRVIEKCGFVYEGTERRTFKIYDGTIRDSKCYSLLREEWEKRENL